MRTTCTCGTCAAIERDRAERQIGAVIAEAKAHPECFKCLEPITDLSDVRVITVHVDGKPTSVWVHAAHVHAPPMAGA